MELNMHGIIMLQYEDKAIVINYSVETREFCW